MKKTKMVAALLVTACAVSALTGCVKVVKIGEEGALTGEVAFDASQNVADIWDSQALPELEGKAVDLTEFLTEANGDLTSLADKYGKYSMGTSGELSYVVKGKGTVDAVDTTKKAGFMTVTLDGYTGPAVVKIQVGTVFKASAVRDSLSFIKYEDYQNQVQWAEVSKSIHSLLQQNVIDPADVNSLAGQKISFTGCFTVSGNDELLITPVVLKAE